MKRPFILALLTATLTLASTINSLAQCTAENNAFQGGEVLSYDLFFNWKFIWVDAGTATMETYNTTWDGLPAYKSSLLTKTSSRLDRFFMMRDTLQSIITKDLAPIYYKKAANEGGKLYIDQVWYSYKDGKTHLRQQYQNRSGNVTHTQYESSNCIYDMMSMMLRARSFDADNFQKGDKLKFPMADGDAVEETTLIYRGKKDFKMKSTGVTYRCLIFSFVEYEKGKEKEIITFYITDDSNHVPVRLDLFLKFGTAKAYLRDSRGLRHPCTSIVK